ncbi:hypothetical protein FA15DRAFT_668684 [Coprinopsis marcescibilis]|uniref:Uncharacterized protein n=1 Tax=Coprinopsis marcescibilis TaxID=230819 RepID=A0A5C3KWW0_COPMA|nr:hypothetical protein FA15DRAFT_668684 [Coprinopsis marcescibilis]
MEEGNLGGGAGASTQPRLTPVELSRSTQSNPLATPRSTGKDEAYLAGPDGCHADSNIPRTPPRTDPPPSQDDDHGLSMFNGNDALSPSPTLRTRAGKGPSRTSKIILSAEDVFVALVSVTIIDHMFVFTRCSFFRNSSRNFESLASRICIQLVLLVLHRSRCFF